MSDEIAAQKLEALFPHEERYRVEDSLLEEGRLTETPIEIRTGHLFVGYVTWYTPYDIGLMLSSRAKVYLFRHAIHDAKVNERVQN